MEPWRGYRDRHKEATLRKVEAVDNGRIVNVDQDIISKYFEVLKETLDSYPLNDRPNLIFNCAESAINLNKTARKVVIHRKSKHCHTIVNANSQRVSVLCCVVTTESVFLPLIIF